MAVVNQDQQQPNVANPQNAPIAAGGSGVAGSTKPASGPAASTPGQNVPAQPSAQLSAYLNANQDQAQAFGQEVAQSVGQTVNNAAQGVAQAPQTFAGNLTNVAPNTAVNQAVTQSPSSLTPDQQAAFQAEVSAGQNVPNSAATFETTPAYQDLAGQVQQAVEQANLWNSGNNPANLTTALAPYEAPGTTQGDTNLDAFLLSQTPGAYGQIQAATAPAAGLQAGLQAGTTQADQALQAAIANDTAAGAGAQGAAQTYATNLQQYLAQQVAQAQASENSQLAENNAINLAGNSQSGALTGGQQPNALTPDQAIALGIPADQAQAFANDFNNLDTSILGLNEQATSTGQPNANLQTVNLANYLKQPTNVPTIDAATVASPTQYADVAALQQLLGTQAPTVPINASTAAQAGTGLNPNVSDTWNPGALSNLLAQAKGVPGSNTLQAYLNELLGNYPAQGGSGGTARVQ